MKKTAVGVVKVLMYKTFLLFGLMLVFSNFAIAEQAIAAPGLKGGVNVSDLYKCEQTLRSVCKNIKLDCLVKNSSKYDFCKQTKILIEKSQSFPNVVENFQNIDVVRMINLSSKLRYNYLMVGNSGELILPNANVNLEKAPGFYDLKQKYPDAILTSQIIDFPQAVFLTASIQKLMIFQQIINPIDQKEVGYAKILYSFSADGIYQGSAAMRIITKPY